jgi:hypothetical protein
MLGNRRLPGRPLLLIAVAAAALFTGAGVAMAATSGGSPPSAVAGLTATPTPSSSSLPGRMHGAGPYRRAGGWLGGGSRPGGPGVGGFGAVHGQFVVAKPGGGYQTIDTQRGSVTAVTGSSITVRSSGGFVTTYQVPSTAHVNAQRAGISSIKTGNQVVVVATVTGSTATATSILDFSLLPRPHGGPGWPGFGGPGPASPAPAAPAG